jgi:transposase-like protein
MFYLSLKLRRNKKFICLCGYHTFGVKNTSVASHKFLKKKDRALKYATDGHGMSLRHPSLKKARQSINWRKASSLEA